MLLGTGALSMNDQGDITGAYLTAPSLTVPNLSHGFVRIAATGMISGFDAPGAGTGRNQGTFPASINAGGDVAGMYADANNAYHGFVRAASTGAITAFDVPGAPTSLGHRGTIPISINTGGDITGFFVDGGAIRHGFVRSAAGNFTTFDVSGAGTSLTQGTIPLSINTTGDIAGFFVDSKDTYHGFLRGGASGTITAPIDAPGAGTGSTVKLNFQGTILGSINAAGDIAGVYADASGIHHGFVRRSGGAMLTFSAPGAGTVGGFPGTNPTSMSSTGDVAGFYTDASGVHHGFVWSATTFAVTGPLDAPGVGGMGTFNGTVPFSINTNGDLAGLFFDTNGMIHGFVLANSSQAAMPTFSPGAGTYPVAQSVALSDTTPGAAIFYTTDGTAPTTSSTPYTGPIPVSSTETIKAMATASGCSNSAIASATYIIAPPAATPTFSPPAGSYASAQNVTISDTTPGATIYYTTDGTTPTTSSTKFTAPVAVTSTKTIKAIAVASGFSNSAVAMATYNINVAAPDFQVSVNPGTLTIVAGQSGTATFTVTPQNGFNLPVNFGCTGLPAEATCSFNPTSITPSGGTAISSTMTITTTGASALMQPNPRSQRPIYALVVPVLTLLLLGISSRRGRELRAASLLSLLVLLALTSTLTSCNGGHTPANSGTPLGTSTVVVSASTNSGSAITHSAGVTVTITH